MHGCALVGGEAHCWGRNEHGQLGSDETTERPYALPVELAPGVPLAGVEALSLGGDHSCARMGGEVYCWGRNDHGELGDGTTAEHVAPAPVVLSTGERLAGVQAISCGRWHTCALAGEGQLYCWGHGLEGQLGNALTDDQPYPTPVKRSPGLPVLGATATDLGESHSCMLQAEGKVSCWGGNSSGQCGVEPSASTTYPTPVEL